jgi:TetR/AcrR family transcriptional regulator, transcriptional repressor for nem operon
MTNIIYLVKHDVHATEGEGIMRRTKQATAESRQAVVEAASRLFREKGFDGVGVADIMAAAKLTHGGFYRHFASKEALIAEAMTEAFTEKAKQLEADDQDEQAQKAQSYVNDYLSAGHLARAGVGCPIAALGSEAPHIGKAVADVFAQGVEKLVAPLTKVIDQSSPDARQSALRLLATLVGAVVIARAVDAPSLRDEVLAAVRAEPLVARMIAAKPASQSPTGL